MWTCFSLKIIYAKKKIKRAKKEPSSICEDEWMNVGFECKRRQILQLQG
jgi:hypothetical protein